ncbi:DUF1838 family protein [Parasphingorhabdus sp.]|uniref:DUF1838 family protein n=1 Tax=Parasphingorhabdus sp. TaxID=2709688 RepID=UPI003266C608
MDLKRRDAMKIMGASAAAVALPAQASGHTPAVPLDLQSPEGRLRTFMLIRHALDERVVVNWAKARYFGMVGDEMTPLFGVASVVLTQSRPTAGGGYRSVSYELGYFTDHEGTTVIDTFDNPYTGETVTIPDGGYPPSVVLIGADLEQRLEKPIPGMTLDHHISPLYQSDGQIWLTERVQSEALFPGATKPFRYNDVSTYHANAEALADPEAKQVPSLVGYSNVVGWRPWLKMPADHPGHLSAFGSGRTGSRFAEVPKAWIDRAKVHRPELLQDPGAFLKSAWGDS